MFRRTIVILLFIFFSSTGFKASALSCFPPVVFEDDVFSIVSGADLVLIGEVISLNGNDVSVNVRLASTNSQLWSQFGGGDWVWVSYELLIEKVLKGEFDASKINLQGKKGYTNAAYPSMTNVDVPSIGVSYIFFLEDGDTLVYNSECGGKLGFINATHKNINLVLNALGSEGYKIEGLEKKEKNLSIVEGRKLPLKTLLSKLILLGLAFWGFLILISMIVKSKAKK